MTTRKRKLWKGESESSLLFPIMVFVAIFILILMIFISGLVFGLINKLDPSYASSSFGSVTHTASSIWFPAVFVTLIGIVFILLAFSIQEKK